MSSRSKLSKAHVVVLAVALFVSPWLTTTTPAVASTPAVKVVWAPAQPALAPHGPLTAVSCVSATFCMAVDESGNALQFNGTGWSTPVNVDGHAEVLDVVSCASATFCVAVDSNNQVVRFNGSTWGAPTMVDPINQWGSNHLGSMSCVTTTFCMGVDDDGMGVKFNGTTWGDPATIGLGYLSSVSCTSATFCVAVDENARAVRYNGTSWSAAADIAGTSDLALLSVSCVSTSFCVAVGDDVSGQGGVLRFNGASWTAPITVNDFNGLTSVSCVSATFCMAIDMQGDPTRYNGTTWSTPTDNGRNVGLSSVSCGSPTLCVTFDGDGGMVQFDGTAWHSPVIVDAFNQLSSVSCVSASFCVAVDAAGEAIQFDGTSWSSPSTIDGTSDLRSVSCVSTSFCVAVDADGNALQFNGTGWGAPSAIDPVDSSSGYNLSSVSCTSTTFCIAVDYAGQALEFSGNSWGAPTVIDDLPIHSVSCVSTTFCLASNGSDEMRFDGASWTPPQATGGGAGSVSCVSALFCVAVDELGNAKQFNGTAWTESVQVNVYELDAVSCASATLCVAIDARGRALEFNGSTWSGATSIDDTFATGRSVSCPLTDFCLAVNVFGNSVIGGLTTDTTSPIVSLGSHPTGFTRSRAADVYFTVSDPDDSPDNLHAKCALDGASAEDCDSPFIAANLADGPHTLAIHATDFVENSSNTVLASWTVDTVVPTAAMPVRPVFGLPSSMGLSWSGTDARSGIANYDVRYARANYTTGFAAWVYPASWQHTTALKATITGVPAGYDYCFAVRSRDKAGNVSAWTANRCTARPLDDRALAASTGWTRASSTAYYGGTYTATTKLNATLTRTGAYLTRIGLVATTCPGCGKVGVYVNGGLFRTINLYSATTHRQVIIGLPTFSYRKATIVLKVLTSGKTIQIDGLGLSRT